jgi:hypothetical protein
MVYEKGELIKLVIDGQSMMVTLKSCLVGELHVKQVFPIDELMKKKQPEALDPDANNADFNQFLKRNGLA